ESLERQLGVIEGLDHSKLPLERLDLASCRRRLALRSQLTEDLRRRQVEAGERGLQAVALEDHLERGEVRQVALQVGRGLREECAYELDEADTARDRRQLPVDRARADRAGDGENERHRQKGGAP